MVSRGRKRTHTLIEKCRARSSRCGGLSLVHLTFHAWVGWVSEIYIHIHILWVVIVWCSLIEVNSVSGKKSIDTRVCVVSYCHDELPIASINQPLASITHNTFGYCPYVLTLLETAVYRALRTRRQGRQGANKWTRERTKEISNKRTNERIHHRTSRLRKLT